MSNGFILSWIIKKVWRWYKVVSKTMNNKVTNYQKIFKQETEINKSSQDHVSTKNLEKER